MVFSPNFIISLHLHNIPLCIYITSRLSPFPIVRAWLLVSGTYFKMSPNETPRQRSMQKQEVYFPVHQGQSVPWGIWWESNPEWLLQAVFILFRGTGYISKVTVQTYWLSMLTFKSIGQQVWQAFELYLGLSRGLADYQSVHSEIFLLKNVPVAGEWNLA